MKKLVFIIISVFALQIAKAQTEKVEPTLPKSYIGISSGINNSCGLLGVQFEQQLGSRFTLFSGLGIGTWGNKVTLGTRIYGKAPLGSAFGISLSCATGVNGVKSNLEVMENGVAVKKDVVFNAKPVYLLNLTWIKFWPVGVKNKFSFELGYGLKLSQNNYDMVPSTVVLSDLSKKAMALIEPGGLTVGIGFHFGL